MSNAIAYAPANLKHALDSILDGNFDDAKQIASATAANGRMRGRDLLTDKAGKIWQVADLLDKANDAINAKDYDAAKALAKDAAEIMRALQDEGFFRRGLGSEIIDQAGELWQKANTQAKKQAATASTSVPMIDQWSLPHPKGPVYCGVATALMLLQANGSDLEGTYEDLSYIASQMYIPGDGTSGAAMADFLRNQGLGNSNFTTSGTNRDINESLKSGQPVPLGVMSSQGTVTNLGSGGSRNHPSRKVGDSHYRTFTGSGHWVLVTGTEGDPNNPSAYIINDPDLGGEFRATPAQLSSMALGNGNYWVVKQN